MPGFGSAVLEVLVGLIHLALTPALAAHKFHLQVERAPSARCRSQSHHPAAGHRAHPASTHALPTDSSHHSRVHAATLMGYVDGLEHSRDMKDQQWSEHYVKAASDGATRNRVRSATWQCKGKGPLYRHMALDTMGKLQPINILSLKGELAEDKEKKLFCFRNTYPLSLTCSGIFCPYWA